MKLGESDAPVEEVCGPGADASFDQLISALGHIARQKPKPLIDTIMLWRKAKGDSAIMAKQIASSQVCFDNIPLAIEMGFFPANSHPSQLVENGTPGERPSHKAKY